MGNKNDTDVSVTEYESNSSITADRHSRKPSHQLSQNAVTVTNEITVTYQDAADLSEMQPTSSIGVRDRNGTSMV